MGSAIGENSRSLLSKMATNDGHGENSPYFDGWKAYDSDPYHPINNPKGVIQMGLAENQLCADLIRDWIMKNPEASICTTQGLHAFMDVANFQDYHGLADFRQGLAKFMGAARGGRASFDPDRIVMSGGATGANETIMFCLADPGDVFLVPSPYYPAFDRDLRWRTGVEIVPIRCESSNNFQITRTALEESYEKARQQNLRVKGLILTNPSNPLGTVADGATLRGLVRFVTDKKIHLVCDEIYAGTVFATPDFTSVAEVVRDTPCNLDLIHIVYSLSKDMGLPGFRVGVVYSYNDAVVAAARKMSSFGLVSSQTQRLLAAMLSDDEFVGRFLGECARRLGDRHRKLTRGLAEVGIGCLKSNAGLYCWMDLRGLLKEATEAEELALWRLIIKDVKLNVSPGSSFRCPEPGWFRVCFANMGDEVVDVALERITKFVGRGKGTVVETAAKRKRWQNSTLRLSFSGRNNRYDEGIMSPRSPMPHSPLVEART